MKSRATLLLTLITTSLLLASQDPWKGEEYAKNSESQKSSADDFLQGMQFQGITAILDVGCGDGKITAAMARAIPQGSVIGVDISPSMIETAKTSFSASKNLTFQVQDAAKLDFKEQFDLITSFTVMQWVLEQSQALQCFERALKPGGKLWIQMPTDLPVAMKEALKQTLSSEKWKSYFVQFKAPWRFYQPDEYQSLLIDAKLHPTRLNVVTKHEKFPSRTAFHGFLKQWFPYLRPLPADQKDAFLTNLLDHYLTILPSDDEGRVSFIVDRLEVEAMKFTVSDQMLRQKIDDSIQRHSHFNGAVLVAKEGKIILSKGYGFANYELNIPNTPQTKFPIASLTKPFTALAIMQLQEKQLLNVQDPISKFIPHFPNGDKITIHHLLSHTSGIANYYKPPHFSDIALCKNLEEMISAIKAWPTEFEPGAEYSYSNSGYVVLAYIIEKVSRTNYDAFLHDNVFKPLGMQTSGHNSGLTNHAVGYVESTGERQTVPPISNPTILIGNGNLYSSVEDLYRWDQALHSGKIVSKKSLEAIFSPHIFMEGSTKRSHGYGWFIDEQLNKKFVEYSGALRGFLSKYIHFIDDQTTIILVTNLENRDQFCQICDDLVTMTVTQ